MGFLPLSLILSPHSMVSHTDKIPKYGVMKYGYIVIDWNSYEKFNGGDRS